MEQLEQGAHSRDELISEHLELIGQIVHSLAVSFPRHVDREELWSAGALGLVEAAGRFDPGVGIPFPRYAAIRIRGAILDSTRSRDWVSRSVRRESREMRDAGSTYQDKTGVAPSRGELARMLGISDEEVSRRQARAAGSMLLYLDKEMGESTTLRDQVVEAREDLVPDAALHRSELIGTLLEAVVNLPELHGDVVRRYYLEGEMLQDIAAELGVTEARVSQIRAEGLASLRAYFSSLYDGVPEAADDAPGKRARAAYLAQLAAQSTWRSRLDAAEGSSDARPVAQTG
jgi:RNA polymerase sigma factor for flagellar operon FliA